MMQRNIGVEATVMSPQPTPIVAELSGLHRELFAPAYVSDERVSKAVQAKVLAYRLGDEVDSRLKPRYLARAIQIEEGFSWSKMFGNFAGTAAAFQSMLNTAVQDANGFVIQRDTQAIQALVVALQKYRALVDRLEGTNVSNTMRLSAGYCSGLVKELHELFTDAEHWASVTDDGTVYVAELDRKALQDPGLKKLPMTKKPEGAVVRLTASGLDAFRTWAVKASDPNSFLGEFSAPESARAGTGQPEYEIDIYGRTGGLPLPHPSFASPVLRVMVELMSIAEQTHMPTLQFRYNGWRRAYETRVPTGYADAYLKAVRGNEEMGSLRGNHDWWIERIGEQVKVVIPTHPSTHIDHFVNYSKSLLRQVAMIFNHLSDMDRTSDIDFDAAGSDGVSLREKLESFERVFQELIVMQRHLEEERRRDPDMRTQESYAVSALIDRLIFSVKQYRNLYHQRNAAGSLADFVDRCLNSNVFSLLEHIPGSSERVPKVDIAAVGPRIPFTPINWIKAHKLMVSLYELMVDVAGAFDEDSRYPVDVNISYNWDAVNRRVIITNLDGRFIDYFRGLNPDKEPHLVPGPARMIYELARQVAPAGQMLEIDPKNNIMYVPIAIDESAIPVSPSMASISAPHPSLYRREDS